MFRPPETVLTQSQRFWILVLFALPCIGLRFPNLVQRVSGQMTLQYVSVKSRCTFVDDNILQGTWIKVDHCESPNMPHKNLTSLRNQERKGHEFIEVLNMYDSWHGYHIHTVLLTEFSFCNPNR